MQNKVMLYVVGPALNVKGGITPVEHEVLKFAQTKGYTTRHFASSVNGNFLRKISILIVSLLKFLFYLLIDHKRYTLIVHIMAVGYNSFRRKMLFGLITSFFKIKYIVHLHSYNFFFYFKKNSRFENILVEYLLNRSTSILSVSKEINDSVLKMGFRNVHILHNPVTITSAKKKDKSTRDEIVLLVLARYAKEKNIDFLIECIDRIRHMEIQPTILKIYGYGDRQKYKFMVQKKGLEKYVFLNDWVEGEERNREMRGADVFVLASNFEGLPVFLLEGLALGKPILASDVPGCRETVVDGFNGFLFKCLDIEDFCAKYQTLLRGWEIVEYGKMSKKLYRAKYTKNIFIKNLNTVYTNMLQ